MFVKISFDFFSRFSRFDHFPGVQYLQADAAGKIAAVDHMNMTQLRRGDHAVLMGTGKGAAQIEVNHFMPLFHKRTKIFQILAGIDGGSFGEDVSVIINTVNVFGNDIHTVQILFILQHHMEGNGMHIVFLTKSVA